MSWLTVREPYAAPPKMFDVTPTRAATAQDIELLGRRAHVTDAVVDADTAALLNGYDEVELDESAVERATLGDDAPLLFGHRSTFSHCDLSRATFGRLRQCRIRDSKLTGTDFSDAELTDVVFERCMLHLTQFRMARLERVRFDDCRLVEVDAFEMVATDVSFDGSELEQLNVDRVRSTRVDFRRARSLSFEAVRRLDGCLVAEHQLYGLAHDLAAAAGLDVETPPR